ncbi:MAG: S8 family serine peptidase [Bacteroidota bacterium]
MKNQLKTLAKLLVLSVFLNSCEKDDNEFESDEIGSETTETTETTEAVVAAQAIPGEYIVVYKENKSLAGKALQMKAKTNQVLAKNGIKENKVKYVYDNVAQGFAIKNLSEAELELLKEDDQVAYVVPNYIYQLDIEMGEPTDVLLATTESKAPTANAKLSNDEIIPWGVKRVGSGNGAGKKCWIIDTGIAPHNELIIDAANSISFVEGRNWHDEHGHGTNVAGVIAAKKGNGPGVVGVAYGATVVSVRMFDANWKSSNATFIAAADYVAGKIKPGEVWNASVASGPNPSQELINNAFRKLGEKAPGAIAAGNQNTTTVSTFPASLDTKNTWIVGAITDTDAAYSRSNYGANVDCWAPGQDIWTTTIKGGYYKTEGTSMAAPHVAGILLLRGNNTIAKNGTVTKGDETAPIAVLESSSSTGEYINGQWYTVNGMQLYRWNDQWWWLNANGEWAYWDGFDWVVA